MENIYLFKILVNNSDKLTNLFLLLASSLIIRQSVIFAGQNWIRTKSHTITLLLLPIITHAITSVISNNIALSLGMVGALSIVRFRNPVKSPFELVVYFLLITAGITASTDIKWLIILIIFSSFLIISLEIFNRFFYNFTKKNFFINSFSESNNLSILEINSNKPQEFLKKNKLLVSFVESEKFSNYRFSCDDEQKLLSLSEEIKNNCENVEIRFSKD
jgi:hypothetical protein